LKLQSFFCAITTLPPQATVFGGLTFILYPNGKFNIEYDYNKPEGDEETDETITGTEEK